MAVSDLKPVDVNLEERVTALEENNGGGSNGESRMGLVPHRRHGGMRNLPQCAHENRFFFSNRVSGKL